MQRSARLTSPTLQDSASTDIQTQDDLPSRTVAESNDNSVAVCGPKRKRRRSPHTRPHGALPNLPSAVPPHGNGTLSESAKLDLLQEKTGYTFKDQDLARVALNMMELSKEHTGRTLKRGMGTSCQNLAILGDLAMELAMADKWFEIASTPSKYAGALPIHICPKKSSNLTNLVAIWQVAKERITPNKALGQFCTDSGLFRCYGGRPTTSTWILATVVEAVLGAIYLDSSKSLGAVQGAMEWLGILQAGMEALEAAEIAREAEKAGKESGQAVDQRVTTAKEREHEHKKERILIEISDDDENMEDARGSDADDEDENRSQSEHQ